MEAGLFPSDVDFIDPYDELEWKGSDSRVPQRTRTM